MDIASFIGRFHPLVVHLPIGFLILAAILKVLSSRYPVRFSDLDKAIGITLLLGSASAIMACILGYYLSVEGGYEGGAIFWHKWAGIGVAIISFATWVVHNRSNAQSYLSPALFAVFSILLIVTGHLGGNLTHGGDYLLVYAPESVQKLLGHNTSDKHEVLIPSNPDSIIVYEHIINPILRAKCFRCHNDSKSNGGLILTTNEAVLAGGDQGKFVVAGNLHESGFFERVTLGQRSKKFMPPSGEPLTYSEIQMVEWWIQEGASFEGSLTANEVAGNIKNLLLQEFNIDTKPKSFYDQVVISPINDDILKEFDSNGFKVSKLSSQNELLDVKISDAAFEQGKLSSLFKAKEHITWLDLSNQNISDQALLDFSQFTNLSRLELSNTPLTDKGLEYLTGLSNLESLNLHSTKVTDKSVITVGELTTLKRIYLWNTNYTSDGIAQLQSALPDLEIVF